MSSREVPAMANTTHRPSLCWLCYWGTAHRRWCHSQIFFFFFNDTATTEIYTGWYLFPYTTLFRSRPVRLGGQPDPAGRLLPGALHGRSEEHTSELQSHHPISYAVFCLKKKKKK